MTAPNENGPGLTPRPVGAVSEETSLLDAGKSTPPRGDQQGGEAVSDRELLELAAKAAGEVAGDWIGNPHYMNGVLMRWNPLDDDGDALRLAVKLGMVVTVYGKFSAASVDGSLWQSENHYDDPYAATRRAIVRAAAEIGRNMK